MNREVVRQYAVATLVSATVMAALSLYLFVRRGYFTWAIANKAVAATALVVLGIVLLLGPLSRTYDRFDRWILYRKELGILAFIASAIHVYLSMFPLTSNNPLKPFAINPVPAMFGLIGFLMLLILLVISFEPAKNKFSATIWWKFQYHGVRLAGIATLFHLAILKSPGWIDWWNRKFPHDVAHPQLPPASLLTAIFALFVLLVRLTEFAGKPAARYLIPFQFFFAIGTGMVLFLR